ncbi:MAG: nucleoside hydrolase [bacterium]|nr:nucleoside hydrolase [bacterium]
MKKTRMLVATMTACVIGTLWAAEPVRVIFDTDMITDFDDVGALACLHALADAGEAEILATVTCTRGNASVGAVQVINSYYGRGDLPVGCVKDIGIVGDHACHNGKKVDPNSPLIAPDKLHGDGGHYKYRKLLADYPGWYTYADSDLAPDANEVYRKALASAPDKSVTICSVGFLSNLRRLLETKGDQYSPLDGKALVAQKVKVWVAMACKYPRGKEYNSMWDAESSKIAIDNWPTPIVFSDWEYGSDVFAGRAIAEMEGPRNPVKDVFAGNIPSREEVRKDPALWQRRCFGMGGRSAWDETAVLAAVRGFDAYFNVHRGRYKMIGDKGENEWVPCEDGPHIRITEKMNKDEVGRVIDGLITRPPAKTKK